jgi:UrcA family protein
MRKFLTRLTTAATLSLAVVPALGLLAPANAAEPAATISLVGLNLSNPAHAAEFEARVDAAGDRVCRDLAHGNPGGNFTIAGCKQAVRKQAASQLSATQRHGLQMAARATPVSVAAR